MFTCESVITLVMGRVVEETYKEPEDDKMAGYQHHQAPIKT